MVIGWRPNTVHNAPRGHCTVYTHIRESHPSKTKTEKREQNTTDAWTPSHPNGISEPPQQNRIPGPEGPENGEVPRYVHMYVGTIIHMLPTGYMSKAVGNKWNMAPLNLMIHALHSARCASHVVLGEDTMR